MRTKPYPILYDCGGLDNTEWRIWWPSGHTTGHYKTKEAAKKAMLKGCPHPPARIYSWFVGDTLCAGCCVCGETLAGGV